MMPGLFRQKFQEASMKTKAVIIIIEAFLFCIPLLAGAENSSYIAAQEGKGRFTLSVPGTAAPLVVSSDDFPGVLRVAKLL